jgi:hypothetical protein
MKKYTEILKEITDTRNCITDTARIEKELEREAMKTAHTNGNTDELEKARTKYKKAEQRYIEELQKNENANLKIQILKDNATQAFFAENINVICDIWNKYIGKSHGEKTSEKIRDEIKTATGYYVSIGNNYITARIRVYSRYNTNDSFNSLEFCPLDYNIKALDNNNKILELKPCDFHVYCCGDYVDDVTAHIEALRKAHAAAKEAENAFKEAVQAYNTLTRGNIQTASTHDGVKNWLI